MVFVRFRSRVSGLLALALVALALPSAGQTTATGFRIVTASLPDGVVGIRYRAPMKAAGGKAPFHWKTGVALLPSGLELDATSGVISGTPSAAGTSEFSVLVTDSSAHPQTIRRDFTIQVANPLGIVRAELPRALAGKPYQARLEASGGTPPLRWAAMGTLPAGLTLTPEGVLNGEPEETGTFHFRAQVRDSAHPSQSITADVGVQITQTISVQWTKAPTLQSGGIYGGVEITNGSREEARLTVIVEAINEIGKAFVLGYMELDLAPDAAREVPFGSALPPGNYAVRAEAVGKSASGETLYVYQQALALTVQ